MCYQDRHKNPDEQLHSNFFYKKKENIFTKKLEK